MIANPLRRQRPIPVAWKPAPLDMQSVGFKGMLVLHVPVRREWNIHQRNAVAQAAADAVIAAITPLEDL